MANSLSLFHQFWPLLLGALSAFFLFSGIDDLIPLTICAYHAVRSRLSSRTPERQAHTLSERQIAIFVPCWQESAVIGNMVRHNLASIRYTNFDFFLGVYPNDQATIDVARQLSAAYRNVHVAVCPNPGPTSKADCLNAIYARMEEMEAERGAYFNTVVLHDAEDLIHPDALQVINRERARYAMVQVPVLPLPTPLSEITHGIYCDEFAEYQTIDMPARFLSRSFIPSNGVGTGFARHILQRLAQERDAIFDPVSLTEDYEIGVYIHSIGHKQLFVPLQRSAFGLVATREYFPRTVRSAVRQRTRWVTGIALQSWERDGWRGSWVTRYWFWRDRKGLVANPISLFTNVLCGFGVADWVVETALHRPWTLGVDNPFVVRLCLASTALQIFRITVRMLCVSRIFGLPFAAALPARILMGNYINSRASLGALKRFAIAKLRREPLVWLKTEHAYPNAESLPAHRRELREVLLSSGLVEPPQLEPFLTETGEDLLRLLQHVGIMDEEGCCQALSLQSGLPIAQVSARSVNRKVVQSLPADVGQRFHVVPFSVRAGRLLVASDRVPAPETIQELKPLSRLPLEFQLVTSSQLIELRQLQER